MDSGITRREFIATGSAAMALTMLPSEGAVPLQAAPETLRCGFIGVGGRGTHLLKQALGLEGVEVAAVCDIDPGNRGRAGDLVEEAQGQRPQELGADPFEYRDLLQSQDIDCAVIATPCDWHSKMYYDALAADRHFYGEKPLAITAKGCQLLKATRERHPNVVIQIGFQWGAHRGRADVIRRVREGEIGELIEGRFHRHNGWGGPGGWYGRRERSGDWMLEQAVHEFNLLWWVIGAHPVAAYAAGRGGVLEPGNAERTVTDFYTAILEYPAGLTVHYTHGWISPPGFTGIETKFVGTEGALDVLGAYTQVRGEGDKRPGEGPEGDTAEHLQSFFDAVRAGDPSLCNCGLDNGLGASYVGLMIRKSIDEKRRVTFAEMLDDPRDLPALPPV